MRECVSVCLLTWIGKDEAAWPQRIAGTSVVVRLQIVEVKQPLGRDGRCWRALRQLVPPDEVRAELKIGEVRVGIPALVAMVV